MINICFCGTCLLWPFVLLFHVTGFEIIQFNRFYSLIFAIPFLSALSRFLFRFFHRGISFILVYNLFLIVIPMKYISKCYLTSFLIVIPSISRKSFLDSFLFGIIRFVLVIDRYYFEIKHSPLVLSAIVCSFLSVCLTMIPKEWFKTTEKSRMKQAFALLSKDSNLNSNIGSMGIGGGTTTTTSSTFDQIHAQRRLRNALLYNEIKI